MTRHPPNDGDAVPDDLIIDSLEGRTTPEEEERLRTWRLLSPENERRYQDIREVWLLTEGRIPEDSEDLPDVDTLIERASAPDHQDEDVTPIAAGRSGESPSVGTASFGSSWLRRAALGALAAGLVAVGFGVGELSDPDGRAPSFLAEAEIVTGSQELTTVTLGDGSTVRLGPRSRLRLAEKEGRRLAWLEGRAYFGVQADSTRPFTVRTENGKAKALGTRFEVRSEADEFRVLVVEGAVSVSADGENVSVSDRQMSRSVRGRPLSTERVDDVHRHLDWVGNTLVFQATPVGRAVSELERHYGVDVVLDDPSLAEISVTATFTERPLDEVVLVLCEIVRTSCSVDDEQVRIGTVETDIDVGTEQR